MQLSVQVYDFVVEDYKLNRKFFEDRHDKAQVWVPECLLMNERLDLGQSFGIVAPPGGGKTVMAQMATIAKPRRTLFLVPIKRLAKRHQNLFRAMGGRLQTRVIIGETSNKQRDWFNPNDRIVFATGHVVVAELLANPTILQSFDLIVFDEMHNAASSAYAYSQIAQLAKKLDIVRLGLTASPGNSKKKINQTLVNCCLDRFYKIGVSVAKQIGSVLHTEMVSIPTHRKQCFFEDYIKTEMRALAYTLNWQAKNITGISLGLDSEKHIGYYPIKKLREGILQIYPDKQLYENHHLFENKAAGKLLSFFEEYHKWEHIYELAQTQCYQAIGEYYKNKILNSTAWYAKRIIEKGRVNQLLNLMANSIHPKLEMLQTVMESLVRRDLQAIVFVSNKVTAKAAFDHLTKLGIKCGLMLGGNSMKPAEQEAVLEQMEDRELQCIIATTVLREGFNLSVDVIINMTPPSSVIDQIQRSGRAGRHARNAEIIYFTTERERPIVYVIDRNIRRLGLSDVSQFVNRLIPEEQIIDYDNLGEVVEHFTEPSPPPHRRVFQPNLF